MKKFTILMSFYLVFSSFPLIAQITSSTWLNPKPSGERYLDIKMSSVNNAIAVGTNGAIVVSTNAGVNWQLVPSNTTEYLSTVSFPEQNTGFIGGSNGMILKTSDAGFTWNQQVSPVNTDFTSSYFITRNNGYLIGYNTILKYNGSTWTELAHSFSSANFTDVLFVNYLTGFICGWDGPESFLIKTTDSGITWSDVAIPQMSGIVTSMDFNGENNGWLISSRGELIRTTNGGGSWSLSSITTNYIREIDFKTNDYGIIVGEKGTVLVSADSGKSWTNKHPLGSQEPNFFSFDNSGTFILAIGDAGVISRSLNGGNSWSRKDINLFHSKVEDIQFLDANIGFIHAAEYLGVNDIGIFKTTDGGVSWSPSESGISDPIAALEIVANNAAFASTDNSGINYIYKSIDNGTQWLQVYAVDSTYKTSDIYFLNSNIGWVLGEKEIYKTTNGGTSWNIFQIPSYHYGVTDIFFINELRGFVTQPNGRLLKTFDGGLTWTVAITNTTERLNSIEFADENNGWVAGAHGTVLRTTNGGVSWVRLILNPGIDLTAIKFRGSLYGYISGTDGTLFYTVDGGNTWLNEDSRFGGKLIYAIEFAGQDKVYFGGESGLLKLNTIPDNIYLNNLILSLNNPFGVPGDTVTIDLSVELIDGTSFSSGLIKIGDFSPHLQFIEIDTTQSLLSSAGHEIIVNDQDTLVIIAFAGASAIGNNGKLLSLKFSILDDVQEIIPVNIISALFDTGIYEVEITNGYVTVLRPFYGDVDLNQLVQPYDASVILKYLIGNYPELTLQQKINADVTLDQSISALDASIILKYTAGLFDTLPQPTVIIPGGDVVLPDFVSPKNGKVLLPIYVSNFENVFSFEGRLQFDNSILKFEDIHYGNSGAGMMVQDTASEGFVKFAAASTNGIVPEGTLFTIEFSRVDSLSTTPTYILYKNMRLNEAEEKIDFDSCLVDFTTGVKDESAPTSFSLQQNYPNPFNPTTQIEYSLPKDTRVVLEVFNILGEKVATLINERKGAGHYNVEFSGKGLTSGIYIYRIKTDDSCALKKMLLLK